MSWLPDNQGGLLDGLQLAPPLPNLLVPFAHGHGLGLGDLHRARRIDVDGALVAPRPEVLAGLLAGFGRLEEQEQVPILGDLRILPGHLIYLWVLALEFSCPRSRADQHEAHELGVAQRQSLGDVTADGESENVGLRNAQRPDDRGAVITEGLERVRHLAAGPGHPGVVEQDHFPVRGQPVGDRRVPVVHPAAEVHQEHQWGATRLAEPAVCMPDSSASTYCVGAVMCVCDMFCSSAAHSGHARTLSSMSGSVLEADRHPHDAALGEEVVLGIDQQDGRAAGIVGLGHNLASLPAGVPGQRGGKYP